MFDVLNGLRVVEVASFIAAPIAGLHLAQLGAEVIRVDPIRNGHDHDRWPLAEDGTSLYWEGLNKGKTTIAVDLTQDDGKNLVRDLIAETGILLTNYPPNSFLNHAALAARRQDQITLSVMGWADGRTAVDYTVNAAMGLPYMTGPAECDGPVNHVLPAWDLISGAYAAFALLAALHHRRETGEGQEVSVPLGEVALSTLGHLGQIAETFLGGSGRPRFGNSLFGAFGRDFQTADGRDVMVVAITRGQWLALVDALKIQGEIERLENQLRVRFDLDQGVRFQHREVLEPVVEKEVSRMSLPELKDLFSGTRVCWEVYQRFEDALALHRLNPILSVQDHAGGTYPTPGAAAEFGSLPRHPAGATSRRGKDTNSVLNQILGLGPSTVTKLRRNGIIQ